MSPTDTENTSKPNKTKAPQPKPVVQADPTPHWTFLSNHSHVLILIKQDPSMVIREIAARVGITERAVQRIIADLEREGFLKREKLGRQNHYRVLDNKPLRHAIECHRTVRDLLNLIIGENGPGFNG